MRNLQKLKLKRKEWLYLDFLDMWHIFIRFHRQWNLLLSRALPHRGHQWARHTRVSVRLLTVRSVPCILDTHLVQDHMWRGDILLHYGSFKVQKRVLSAALLHFAVTDYWMSAPVSVPGEHTKEGALHVSITPQHSHRHLHYPQCNSTLGS